MQIGSARNCRASFVALTDRGRVIPLSELHADIEVDGWIEAEDRRFADRDTHHEFIRLAPPDPAANCHGWVFAEGRFWVDGNDVNHILADNGYYEAPPPSPATSSSTTPETRSSTRVSSA